MPRSLLMGQTIWRPLLITALLILMLDLFYGSVVKQSAERGVEISYTRFRDELAADNVKKVTLRGNYVRGEFRAKVMLPAPQEPKGALQANTFFNCNLPSLGDPTLLPELNARKVEVMVVPAEGSTAGNLLIYLLPWLLILGVWWFVMRGMKTQGPGAMMGSFARSGAKAYNSERANVAFVDVA